MTNVMGSLNIPIVPASNIENIGTDCPLKDGSARRPWEAAKSTPLFAKVPCFSRLTDNLIPLVKSNIFGQWPATLDLVVERRSNSLVLVPPRR